MHLSLFFCNREGIDVWNTRSVFDILFSLLYNFSCYFSTEKEAKKSVSLTLGVKQWFLWANEKKRVVNKARNKWKEKELRRMTFSIQVEVRKYCFFLILSFLCHGIYNIQCINVSLGWLLMRVYFRLLKPAFNFLEEIAIINGNY